MREREKGAVNGGMDCEERAAGNGVCSEWFLQLIQELDSLRHSFPLKPAASVKALPCLWYIAFWVDVFKIGPFLKFLVCVEICSFNCLNTALFASFYFFLTVCLNAI